MELPNTCVVVFVGEMISDKFRVLEVGVVWTYVFMCMKGKEGGGSGLLISLE